MSATPKPSPLSYSNSEEGAIRTAFGQLVSQPIFTPWSWRWDENQERWTKAPKYPAGRRGVSLDQALSAHRRNACDGIGVKLGRIQATDEILFGVDYDGAEKGPLPQPWPQTKTYEERSPSGGDKFHILGLYKGVPLEAKKTPAVEVYTEARFFTLTGQRINGATILPTDPRPFYAAIGVADPQPYRSVVIANLLPAPIKESDLTQRERQLLQVVRRITDEDPSKQDYMVCAELFSRGASDEEAARILCAGFWRSKLRRKDYVGRTIAKARENAGPSEAEAAKRQEKAVKALQRPAQKAPLLQHAFWVKDSKPTLDLPYVVKGLFGRKQIIVFWGASGSGKTFVVMEMACAVGAGVPWRGRKTKGGIVLYIAAESSRAYIENRFVGLKQERPDIAKAKVLVLPLALDLRSDATDVSRVIDAAKQLDEVALIIIDTLAATFAGGDENTSEDMGAYITNLLRIRDETNAAVLVIHHSGKDEAKGMRGHSALLGILDAELAIEGKEPPRILKTGKVRDGDGYRDLFAFRLRPVELGIDSDGDPVPTCVIDSSDPALARRDRKLGKNQACVLQMVKKHGGRMARADLVAKLHAKEGLAKNRIHEAIGALIHAGDLIRPSASELSLPR